MLKKSILILFLASNVLFANCDKPKSQSEMNECSSSDYNTLDKELNRVYKELMSKLTDTEKEQLKKNKENGLHIETVKQQKMQQSFQVVVWQV